MGTWWFARHGESVANAEGWLAGFHDTPLTPRGVSQAKLLCVELAELRPQRVVSSDLQRAFETAKLAYPRPEPVIEQHEGLRERSVGDWEQVPMAELRSNGGLNRLLTWEGRPPKGESQQDLARRVLSWLATNDDGRDTLSFVHGGLIRVVVGLLDGTPREHIGSWKVRNTEVVGREVGPGDWSRLLEAQQ